MFGRNVARFAAGVVLTLTALAGGLSGAAGAAGTPALTPTSGYVARSGSTLTVNGKPWKFAGFNLPCANPFSLTPAELSYYLQDIQASSGSNVVRMWFFQSELESGGTPNWAPFDQVVAAVKAQGMRAIITLTNEWSACDGASAPPEKDLAWYQSGYTHPDSGYLYSFQSYATQVAAHYANEPTVAFWQLVNEAGAPTITATGQVSCNSNSAMVALRSFSDTMATALHGVDPHHLVDLGTGGGSCGLDTAAADTYVHAGSLDLCEYHDYGSSSTAMSAGLNQTINDCHADGKPAYVGESGIPANVQPNGSPETPCSPWPSCSPDPLTLSTLAQRASFFKAKILAGNAAGIAGYVIWVDSPFYSPSTEAYDVGDGDPTLAVLPNALAAYPIIPAATPEAPWVPLLAGTGFVVLAGAGVVSRRRLGRTGR